MLQHLPRFPRGSPPVDQISVVRFVVKFSAWKVDEYNAVRMKLTAEMADSANLVKVKLGKNGEKAFRGGGNSDIFYVQLEPWGNDPI